jgi:hypothetical protein
MFLNELTNIFDMVIGGVYNIQLLPHSEENRIAVVRNGIEMASELLESTSYDASDWRSNHLRNLPVAASLKEMRVAANELDHSLSAFMHRHDLVSLPEDDGFKISLASDLVGPRFWGVLTQLDGGVDVGERLESDFLKTREWKARKTLERFHQGQVEALVDQAVNTAILMPWEGFSNKPGTYRPHASLYSHLVKNHASTPFLELPGGLKTQVVNGAFWENLVGMSVANRQRDWRTVGECLSDHYDFLSKDFAIEEGVVAMRRAITQSRTSLEDFLGWVHLSGAVTPVEFERFGDFVKDLNMPDFPDASLIYLRSGLQWDSEAWEPKGYGEGIVPGNEWGCTDYLKHPVMKSIQGNEITRRKFVEGMAGFLYKASDISMGNPGFVDQWILASCRAAGSDPRTSKDLLEAISGPTKKRFMRSAAEYESSKS